MKEIGGYIELDTYTLPMLHEEALAFNLGRNCLAWLIDKKNIKKIKLPYFLCDTVKAICKSIDVKFYYVDENFLPQNIMLEDDEWLYLVNYYGQLSENVIKEYVKQYKRVIVDNVQAYFDKAVVGAYTIYTCWKYFGVPDGAFLVSDDISIKKGYEELDQDVSNERMRCLLGRFESGANAYYLEYMANKKSFVNLPIRKMSLLTNNLLHGIDYDKVKNVRNRNYRKLSEKLSITNRLKLKEVNGAFAYPYWTENGKELRKYLQEKKIYIPLLWPNVIAEMNVDELEYDMALNILPIPCDQRYGEEDMEYICEMLDKFAN